MHAFIWSPARQARYGAWPLDSRFAHAQGRTSTNLDSQRLQVPVACHRLDLASFSFFFMVCIFHDLVDRHF